MYREYKVPINVSFRTLDGYNSGQALGVREVSIPERPGKSQFFFLVLTDDGPVMVRQKDVLPGRHQVGAKTSK